MADNEPPDEGSGRPPIHTLDEPIDDSGADEAEARRSRRRSQAELPVAAVEALKLKGLGFSILPLPTHEKAPPPKDWSKAANNNPAVFLQNPGTNNYGILPPPGCFGWDVDKDVPELLQKVEDSLGVGPGGTMTTYTPNGSHRFYRWPEDLARPKGPMFGGVVTRWPLDEEGQGYLVGPGSVVVQENGSLGVYHLLIADDDAPIADLPRVWAEAALNWRPAKVVKAGPLAEVREHYELPESVAEGMRYEAIRNYTAHLYNKRMTKAQMWLLVKDELAPLFSVPLSEPELRDRFNRAVKDIEVNLGEPKAATELGFGSAAPSLDVSDGAEHTPLGQEPSSPLASPLRAVPLQEFADELRARDPIEYLVQGWVPGHALTVIAGHPKSMKSLAVMQLLGAFVAGGSFLAADVAAGGTNVGIYLTREGSYAEMLSRADALLFRHNGSAVASRLRVIYEAPVEFDARSYKLMSEMLAALESEMSVLPGPLRVMLVLDPLRDLMPDGGDENEAKTMAVVKKWCRTLIADWPFLSIVLVHHLRKSASGSTGLEMSGSGAMYGAVDSTIVWKAKKEDAPEDDDGPLVFVGEMFGTYRVETRGDAPFTGRWRFDATDGLIVPGVGRVETASGRAVPGTGRDAVLDVVRGAGLGGIVPVGVAEQVGIADGNARKQLGRLEAKGQVIKEGGRWYGAGLAPHQQRDVILPEEEPAQAGDDEVWVDPLHRLND